MGGNFSEPVPDLLNASGSDFSVDGEGGEGGAQFGYVCFVLRSYDKLRLLHATPEVLKVVTRVLREVSHDPDLDCEDRYGAAQFRLPGSPFVMAAGRESSTLGKMAAIRIFEEMNAMGYEMVASADLSRQFDQSSWFFRKSVDSRPRHPVLCVSPSSTDKLVLLRTCDYVIQAVKEVIENYWLPGLQNEKSEEVNGEVLKEFKLRGYPWQGEGEESTLCRRLLLEIVSSLGKLKWRLFTSTNLKGGTDALFFIYDEEHHLQEDLAMLSMNRHDRLRLINFDSAARGAVHLAILHFYQRKEPEERNYHDAFEFKLKGYPFASSGSEAVNVRQLICRILESLRELGWEVMATVDVSRKMTDKSTFLFRRCESAKIKFACVALSEVDKIRLLNFPPDMSRHILMLISKAYLPGVSGDWARDASCHEVELNGTPWTHNSSYSLHARSMLARLFREAHLNGWKLTASADVSAKFVHQENGPDYPCDVHSLFFSYQALKRGGSPRPRGTTPARPITPTPMSELKVSDLESSFPAPPSYEQATKQ